MLTAVMNCNDKKIKISLQVTLRYSFIIYMFTLLKIFICLLKGNIVILLTKKMWCWVNTFLQWYVMLSLYLFHRRYFQLKHYQMYMDAKEVEDGKEVLLLLLHRLQKPDCFAFEQCWMLLVFFLPHQGDHIISIRFWYCFFKCNKILFDNQDQSNL